MELTDCHAHSNFSYCADPGLSLEVYRAALDDPGTLLTSQAITNHSFQAYFPPELAWSWTFLDEPELLDEYRDRGDERLAAMKEEITTFGDDRLHFGVEVEMMGNGRLSITEEARRSADIVIGSLHVLPAAYERGRSQEQVFSAFLDYHRDLAGLGIDVIAHPFRWLAEMTRHIPRELVTEVVSIAKAESIALELNIRGLPNLLIAMIEEAVEAQVPLSLATDAHSPGDVGNLEPHLRYIKRAGFEPDQIHLKTL